MDLKNRTVLVTGGGGFMGSHLCEELVRSGAHVRVIDNFDSGRQGNLATIKERLELVNGSVADEEKVKSACHGMDVVVHTAFPMAMRKHSLETDVMVNYLTGLFNLLKETVANNSLMIYISSIAVYGNGRYVPINEKHPLEPVMLHGAMKLAGEYMCRTLAYSHGLKTVILRVADIYGPKNTRVSVPVRFLMNALAGRPLRVFGSGRQSRTYTYVADFVQAVLGVLMNPAAVGRVFNIAGDQVVSMYDLALLVKEIANSGSPVVLEENMPADDRKLIIDGTLARQTLHLGQPVSVREGLVKTRDWLRQEPGFYQYSSGHSYL